MPDAAVPDETVAVRELLRRISAAWSGGRPDDLAALFHERMVIAMSAVGLREEGRDRAVQSYRDFTTNARIIAYEEHDYAIDVRGETAVASYGFELTYEMGGERRTDRGHDLFVFTREQDRWVAVWRTVLPALDSA